MASNLYAHYSTSGTKVIEVDPNASGVFSNIVLERIVVNGGTAGAIAVWESADSSVQATGTDTMIADIDPATGVPISLDFNLVLHGNLILVLAANTDITVVFRRTP